MLRRAGVPIGLETQKLLDANLQLQAELTQTKGDLEDRSIEAARSKRQYEQNERQITCGICMGRRVDTLLNGCGHMLCSLCANQIDRCPYCRGDLAGTTRMRW